MLCAQYVYTQNQTHTCQTIRNDEKDWSNFYRILSLFDWLGEMGDLLGLFVSICCHIYRETDRTL